MLFVFLVACLISSLFVPTAPVFAGALIEGQISEIYDQTDLISIFVTSQVQLEVSWNDGAKYIGIISEVTMLNTEDVQYFRLLPLNGEQISLLNNTLSWTNRGDNLWHRLNVMFELYQAGDGRQWVQFNWAPFWDSRGTPTAVDLEINFPEGIQVIGISECQNGCTLNYHFERDGSTGVATSWNIVFLKPGYQYIYMEWAEAGGLFPESGYKILTVREDYSYFIPLVTN